MAVNEGKMLVIDWTGVDIGYVKLDVACILLLFATVKGEEIIDLLKQQYISQSSYSLDNIDYFLKLVCLRRLSDYVTILTNNRSHPETDLILLQIFNMIDFVKIVTKLNYTPFKEAITSKP